MAATRVYDAEYYKHRSLSSKKTARKWYALANRAVPGGVFEAGHRRDGDMMSRLALKFHIRYLEMRG